MAAKRKIDEEVAIQLWKDGLTDAEIAEKMGCKEKSITNWRNTYGDKKSMPNNKGIFNWSITDKGHLITW